MIATRLSDIHNVIGADGSFDGADVARRVSIDSRCVASGDLFFAIRGERFDGHDFVTDAIGSGACGAVVDRDGVGLLESLDPSRLLIVDDTVAALGRLAAWHRKKAAVRVIAVTGSNGKTTTKNMIAHVLREKFTITAAKASFNNQIGVPLTLLACDEHDDYVVVEIGTNAPGEIGALAQIASPDVSVITSVGIAHLERLGDIEGVRREKLSLLSHTQSTGVVHDDAASAELLESFGLSRAIRFGQSPEADIRLSKIRSTMAGVSAQLSNGTSFTVPLAGAHNAMNAAAAIAVAMEAGMNPSDAANALATFSPPAMRMSYEEIGDVTLICDCYNANPTSMRAAIDVLAKATGRRVLIAGQMAELGESSARFHREIGEYAARIGIEVIASIGSVAAKCVDAVETINRDVSCLRFDSTADAVERLPDELESGDTVLIKGSRVAGLEAVAEAIRSNTSRTALAQR